MESIFPKDSARILSLPIWRSHVVRFLSGHKRYRILWWEFGPTLLNHLHKIKENKSLDYTKNGLVLTYCAAFITVSALLASKRTVVFTVAIASSVLLLGITITVLIDSYNTHEKGNNEAVSEEYCLKLLEELVEMPKYWWWPWSQKIRDIELTEKQEERATKYNSYSFVLRLIQSLFTNVISHQFCVAGYGYFYSYQKLGGKMHNIPIKQLAKDGLKKGYNKFGDGINKMKDGVSSFVSFAVKSEGIKDELEIKSNNLIRRILNVNSTTLNEALSSLQFRWLLRDLDESLKSIRAGTKTEDQHNQYFKSLVKDILKLSLTYHSDKKANKPEGVDADAEQKLINEVIETLRKVHEHVMEKHKCVYNQYYGIYELYGKMAMSALSSGKDILDLVEISPLDGSSIVLDSLHSLTYHEGGHLMRERNEYIKGAKALIEELESSFDLMKSYENGKNSTDSVDTFVKMTKSKFDKHYENYKQCYYIHQIEQLEMLLDKCKKNKRLEIIKDEVKELLKESKKQYKTLTGEESAVANELFVQPALRYKALAEMYSKFITQLNKNIKGCYYSSFGLLGWTRSCNQLLLDEQISILKENNQDNNKFITESKKTVESYSNEDLLKFLSDAIDSYSQNKQDEKGDLEIRMKMKMLSKENASDVEIGKVIVSMLKLLENRLNEKFQKKETYFDREERESKETQQRIEKLKREIEQIEEETKQVNVLAEQNAQRADQIKRVSEVFTEMIFDADMGNKLTKIIIKSQGKIVEAVVQHVMKNNSSPEQVLDAVMKEIKREGAVSDEMINDGIRNFTVRETLDEVLTKVEGINVDHVAQGAGMNRNP